MPSSKPPTARVCTSTPRETSTYLLARRLELGFSTDFHSSPDSSPLHIPQERRGASALSGRLLGKPLPPSQQRVDPHQSLARGVRGEKDARQADLSLSYTRAHSLMRLPPTVLFSLPSSTPSPTLCQSSSSQSVSLPALRSLLDLLHLPALHHHRQHLAPACLERLLHVAQLLREPSEVEEVSLYARTKRERSDEDAAPAL